MAKIPQMTPQTLKVLQAVADGHRRSGAEIAKETKLATGTLYPILLRLEGAGLLASEWEDGDPKALGRPRRRFYSITALGVRVGQSATQKLQSMLGRFQWA